MCENSVISIFDVVVKSLERYENMTLYYLYFFLIWIYVKFGVVVWGNITIFVCYECL